VKTHYTVGFLFNQDKSKVALIRKNRPVWQFNRLNGIGGHVEEDEESSVCMSREFHEEARYPLEISPEWKRYASLDSPTFFVDCFAAIGDLNQIRSKTSEKIEIIEIISIHPNRKVDMIENLPWLISMAIDFLEDGRPFFATIKYEQ